MAGINFTIPVDRAELLSGVSSNYTIKNVVPPNKIVSKLQESQKCLKEQGAEFILDNFDTYYSVLHHANSLRIDVVFTAYDNLYKAVIELDNAIGFLLGDKDSLNDELKEKMVVVLKMLIYIYTQFVLCLEQKKRKNHDDLSRAKNKSKKDERFTVNKMKVLNVLNNLLQREINLFWDPPVVEHDFIGLFAEICYSFLQNPSIKQEKDVRMEIFGVFGNLIQSYDYGKTFVTRLIQSIRMYEHVVHCVSDGIKFVVEQFNCHGLVHHLVKEATEWQVDETFQDVQGTRCCSIFLSELAVLIPKMMMPEMMYLNQYLSFESQPLRNSILNVITELILKVLTKHGLTEEEKESRDEFLEVLIEHMRDVSAVVRSKVMQNLARLQKENAIPLKYQCLVLGKVIEHLYDKAAAVRKSSISCVTVFLEHNLFGANLKLKKTEEQLAYKIEMLNKMESAYKEAKLAKIEELQAEWAAVEDDVKKTIQQELDNPNDEDDETEEASETLQLDKEQIVEVIRAKLQDKKFLEAFKMCRLLKDKIYEWKQMRKLNDEQEINVYLEILRSFFLNTAKITDELRTGAGMSAEDLKKIEALESGINYLENTVAFLRILDLAMEPMKKLLFTQTNSDMHEAIRFFVTAYQFQIDNSSEGVLEMLKLMKYNEPERKDAVIEAFKTIYLTTDAQNMAEHTATILNRLIQLLKNISYDNLDNFQNIVSEWTAKGILDNSVIDKCWQYFTQRESVSNDDARAAVELLRMAAMGRSTIISKNIPVVTTIAFSDKFKDDMMFLASCCRFLAVAGQEKIDIQSKDPPFTITYADPLFQTLSDIIVENFFRKVPYYSEAMQAGFDFIFRVCSKPTELCEEILKQIDNKLRKSPKMTFLMIRFCEMLGYLAIKILAYFDNTVYRELKRRNFVRQGRKENKKKNKKDHKNVTENVNESVLTGAEAGDSDAEFILNTLENDIVTSRGVLGKYFPYIVVICQRPDLYPHLLLQESAVTALLRYMLVSEKFCRENVQLLFTILEKTTSADIKCLILAHYADLMMRFPNTAEPWSPRIYEKLRDPLVEVRRTAFFLLSNLILKDIIRAHSHISEMAACMIDEHEEVQEMCKTFFGKWALKENNLSNAIPDIFSHLVKADDISEENLRYIMKFLFDLVDNSKRAENLVDRFCCKYTVNDDFRVNRNLTYCLSLVNYNDKALKKLHEKFPMYQHHIHDPEIYAIFKQILAECSKTKVGKTDLKPIVADIEKCIASVFELNEDGQAAGPPPRPLPKCTRKAKAKLNKRKPRKKSDGEESNTPSLKNRKS